MTKQPEKKYSSYRDIKKDAISQLPTIAKLIMKTRHAQPAFACSKLAVESLEQGVKYVQS